MEPDLSESNRRKIFCYEKSRWKVQYFHMKGAQIWHTKARCLSLTVWHKALKKADKIHGLDPF